MLDMHFIVFSIVFFGDYQLDVAPEDQEKTTFTCPFGTFAFKECHSVYIMLLQLFKDVCSIFLVIWLRTRWRFSCMTFLFLETKLEIV